MLGMEALFRISGFRVLGFRGALLAPGELAAVHEVLRIAGHELGDEHGAARVHARAQELHHVHVAALLQDRDLRAQPTARVRGSPGQRGAPPKFLRIPPLEVWIYPGVSKRYVWVLPARRPPPHEKPCRHPCLGQEAHTAEGPAAGCFRGAQERTDAGSQCLAQGQRRPVSVQHTCVDGSRPAGGLGFGVCWLGAHLAQEPGLLLGALADDHLHRHVLHLVPQPLVHLRQAETPASAASL